MKRRRLLITAIVLLVLVGLAYLQFRTWRRFDWRTFWEESEDVSLWHVLVAVVFIYADYFLRAVRWKIFLRPMRPQASVAGLTPPNFIGFAGLALLGRLGEFIRPYLIARREHLSFSSQMAVWIVERIFDFGAVGILLALDFMFFNQSLRGDLPPEIYKYFRLVGFLIAGVVVLAGLVAALVRRKGTALARWVESRFSAQAPGLASAIAQKITAFSEGLNTISDARSFLQALVLSLVIWLFVAVAYVQVTHAYLDDTLQSMGVSDVLFLMTASMAGSLVQLPAIGGGSQLLVIAALQGVFGVEPELAVSCGILLWLVTFMAVTPVGLALAKFERISFREITQKSEAGEELV